MQKPVYIITFTNVRESVYNRQVILINYVKEISNFLILPAHHIVTCWYTSLLILSSSKIYVLFNCFVSLTFSVMELR